MQPCPRQNKFYYLIDLHYSQTLISCSILLFLFYYLIDLHYSQTVPFNSPLIFSFYYLIDLHYSQTESLPSRIAFAFYYLIDLHYSQTKPRSCDLRGFVLLPYRFTLFSNLKLGIKCTHYTVHGKSMRLFYNICIMIVNKIRTNHYQSQQVFRIQKLLSALSFQC